MLLIGLLILPTTLFQFLYIKDYWHPPSLLRVSETYGIDIESALWTFFAPGISIAIYSLRTSQSLVARSWWKEVTFLYALGIAGFFTAFLIFKMNSIHSAIAAMIMAVAFGYIYVRPQPRAWLESATIFFGIYIFAFIGIGFLRPDYVQTYWSIGNLSGKFIFGIPLEEIFYGLMAGIFFGQFSEAILSKPKFSKINTQ